MKEIKKIKAIHTSDPSKLVADINAKTFVEGFVKTEAETIEVGTSAVYDWLRVAHIQGRIQMTYIDHKGVEYIFNNFANCLPKSTPECFDSGMDAVTELIKEQVKIHKNS